MAISPLNEQIRRIVISGMIKEDTASIFLEQITSLEYGDVGRSIDIYIDTYGGNVDAAILMYDAMQACACPISTFGIGKVMSAGVLLLAAGDTGHRFLTPNTRVMIHELSGGAFGKTSELDIVVDELARMQVTYVELLAKHSKHSKTQILKDMEIETYMSAEEAIKYGLADGLTLTRKLKKKDKK